MGVEAKAEAEATGDEAKAEAKAAGVEAKAEAEATFFGLEAEARPRGLTSLCRPIEKVNNLSELRYQEAFVVLPKIILHQRGKIMRRMRPVEGKLIVQNKVYDRPGKKLTGKALALAKC
jgi:hypothetical protein